MMIVRASFIFVLSVFSSGLFAQPSDAADTKVNSIAGLLKIMHWNMNAGAAYNFIPNYGGGMNYYAAPGFSYPVTKNISFHGGLLTGFGNSTLPVHGEKNKMGINYGHVSIYGSATYQVNENILFYGTGIRNISRFGEITLISGYSFDEVSLGSTIRLGKSVTVGASMHFRETGFPGYRNYSPFFKY